MILYIFFFFFLNRKGGFKLTRNDGSKFQEQVTISSRDPFNLKKKKRKGGLLQTEKSLTKGNFRSKSNCFLETRLIGSNR